MQLKLYNFRCYKEETINFSPGMTLLKGTSGRGKSTLLNAIYWVLYGSLQKIYPHGAPQTLKTWVELSLSINKKEITVYRQKRPDLLRVTEDSNIYENEIAQGVINAYFGEKEVFLSTSYTIQGDKCRLLTGSNADKMDIINKLIFAEDNPEEFIAQLTTDITENKTKYTTLKEVYERRLEDFLILEEKLDFDAWIEPKDRKEHRNQMEIYKSELPILERQLKDRHASLYLYQNLEKDLKFKESELSKISNITEENWKESINKESELEDMRKQIKINIEKEQLDKEINTLNVTEELISQTQQEIESLTEALNNNIRAVTLKKYTQELEELRKKQPVYTPREGDEKITPKILTEARINETLRERELLLVKKYEVSYDKESVATEIQRLRDYLPQFILQEKQELHRTITRKIDSLKLTETKSSNDLEMNIRELIEKIAVSELATTVLRCPECKGSVCLQKGVLIPSHRQRVSPRFVEDMRDELASLKKLQELVKKKEDLFRQLPVLTPEELNQEVSIPYSQKEILDRISKLEKVTFLQEIDIEHYELVLSYREFMSKVTTLEEKIASLPLIETQGDVKSIETKVTTLKKQLSRYISDFEKKKTLQKSYDTLMFKECSLTLEEVITQLKEAKKKSSEIWTTLQQQKNLKEDIERLIHKLNDIKIPDDCSERCEFLKKEIETWSQQERKLQELDKFFEFEKKMIHDKEILEELYEEGVAMTDLKTLSTEVGCRRLQSVIDTLNVSLESILGYLFEDPIKVQISLFKALKSREAIKQNVTMMVTYRGVEYDIKDLSGGEADRVSLALTLALAQLSPSPLLLLDENLGSLDESLKECATKAIRVICGGKTTIITLHGAVEGFFDTVTDLN